MTIRAIIKSARPGYYYVVWYEQDQVEYVSDAVGELLQRLLLQEGHRQEY